MVSEEKLAIKFIQLEEYLVLLKEIGKTESKKFLKDKILIGSAKYYLQVSMECCLDVGSHIIASEKLRPPKDYADTFTILEENRIIPAALSKRLRQMAKFRNRLVHLYGEIDNEQVYQIIKKDLKDIESFRRIIIRKYSLT
jgi:uncharacterized protein YutE (UPF0331/DUF86 family)